MDQAILGQLNLVLARNQGKADQRGVNLLKKEDAACPELLKLFQAQLCFLASGGIESRGE